MHPNALKNLKSWKPGQSGNPAGRTKLPEELRAIRSITRLEVCKLVSKYARMTKEKLKEHLEDPKTPCIELTIATIFERAFKYGDHSRLSFLLDQAIGKIPISLETEEEKEAREELESLSDQELLRLVKEQYPDLGGSKT